MDIGELERFARVVTWLDDARWVAGDWGEGWESPVVSGLSGSQKVLAHWLTYITDMQMPARTVWTKGLPVFAKIVADYSAGAPPSGLLLGYYRTPMPSPLKVPTLIVTTPPLEFTPRYRWQYDQIERTLELLDDYGRSLAEFMKLFVQRYGSDVGALRRLAHALFILTYANPKGYSNDVARDYLASDNRNKLETDFRRWDDTTTKGGQKRLWAALRDYLKHKELRRCVEETFVWPRQNFELSQLELPGDVWNDVFAVNLLRSVADRADIQTGTGKAKHLSNSPTMARKIYDLIKSSDLSTLFYPEQMDVSFDFASRMCDKRLCDICVFGENDAVQFCSRPGPSKLCTVLLILCGYKRACAVENCPVISGTGSRLCRGGEANR